MKRIIIHWTGGTNNPNNTDRQHYHYLIDSKGNVSNGIYRPEDNENCYDGRYAQHTGGGNTGAIGIAMCGMYVPKNVPVKNSKYPLTKIQCERMFKLVAELSKRYGIIINDKNVMTHYEFGLKNPKTTSFGKIDIIYLAPYPDVSASKIGDFIRGKAIWYTNKL